MAEKYRNAKNVGHYLIGQGCVQQLADILEPLREACPDGPAVFFLDSFFEAHTGLLASLPVFEWDMRVFVDTSHEPSCESVDMYAGRVREFLRGRKPCALIALGGGSTMDTCKCVGNLLTNPGCAADYQGFDLVKNPAPYKIACPTISGTGSETSRTGVMLNRAKGLKLGMNSDYSMFDQVVLDPGLSASVPRDQYFYTGVDTYMHCFESLDGSYRNTVVDSQSEHVIAMCEKIFLSDDMMAEPMRELLMIASYQGGQAAGFVGVVHPLSAGLSVVLGMRHGLANCYALSVLGDIYPAQHELFMKMMRKQGISLPKGICAGLTDAQYDELYEASIVHEKPLMNKLGPKYREILTRQDVIRRFKEM